MCFPCLPRPRSSCPGVKQCPPIHHGLSVHPIAPTYFGGWGHLHMHFCGLVKITMRIPKHPFTLGNHTRLFTTPYSGKVRRKHIPLDSGLGNRRRLAFLSSQSQCSPLTKLCLLKSLQALTFVAISPAECGRTSTFCCRRLPTALPLPGGISNRFPSLPSGCREAFARTPSLSHLSHAWPASCCPSLPLQAPAAPRW